jgi:uncharacterized protein
MPDMEIPTVVPHKLCRFLAQGLFLLLVFANCWSLWAQSDLPSFDALVTDVPGVLSPGIKVELEQKLRNVKRSSATEIAVLIVNTLEGNSAEGYAQEVVRKWKIGEKNKDNGLLLLIAIQERAIRIEVGRGLEGSVPDIIAGRIIRDQMVPLFQNGNIEGGISLGVQRLIELSSGEFGQQPSPSDQMPSINLFWVLVVIGVVFAQLLKAIFGNTLGSLSAGIAMGLLGTILIGLLWGLIIGILVPLFSSGNGRYISGSGSGGGWRGGGFGGGGSISFGGGGSFSGGGASGRW